MAPTPARSYCSRPVTLKKAASNLRGALRGKHMDTQGPTHPACTASAQGRGEQWANHIIDIDLRPCGGLAVALHWLCEPCGPTERYGIAGG
jgi:hypothetical protein